MTAARPEAEQPGTAQPAAARTRATAAETALTESPDRRVPVVFPTRYLVVELRRFLRNRRSLMFTLLMPVALYFAFASGQNARDTSVGHANVAAFVMVSMGLYGAVSAATSAGASVSVETAQGWARTLNLTPLRPVHYVCIKVLLGLTAALIPVAVITLLGALGGARVDGAGWILAPLLAWLGSALFAAFGLLIGLLFPSENVMQFLGLALTVLAFVGNVFIPLHGTMLTVARFTPMYGISALAHWPLTGQIDAGVIANVIVWTVVFAGGAAWRFTRSTARV